MLPEGADSVVRIEDTATHDGRVEVSVEVEPGNNVRRRGDDIEPGATILRRGVTIGAAELGVLASVGLVEISCARRPRTRVLTTGDELLEPGMRPGRAGSETRTPTRSRRSRSAPAPRSPASRR
jgi:molybdopterin biosynthesis enzyme